MMMNYADNLEDIVAEKTGQLIEAKRETEELLYKILPRYCLLLYFVCVWVKVNGNHQIHEVPSCDIKIKRSMLLLLMLSLAFFCSLKFNS